MCTKRKETQSTSRKGVLFVNTLINDNNCIFQEIDHDNDIGNDALIEFITNEVSTGCSINVQIKSGKSYINKSGYFIDGDRSHFKYWENNMLPVCGIVYNPEEKKAMWIDISKYLKDNPEIVENGPYNIYCNNELTENNFKDFRNYFLNYKEFNLPFFENKSLFSNEQVNDYKDYFVNYNQNKMNQSFISSLELLINGAKREEIEDAINLLFSYFRDKKAMWFFICQYFKNIDDEDIIEHLVYNMSLIAGHPDIFWNRRNMINSEIREYSRNLIKVTFKKNQILKLILVFINDPFSRGTISQCAESIINIIPNKLIFLEKISFDPEIDELIQLHAIYLIIYYKQFDNNIDSKDFSINLIEKYISFLNHKEIDEQLLYFYEMLKNDEFSIGY